MTVRNQMALQRSVNYKVKCRKGKLIRCLSISLSFRLLQTTTSHTIAVCKLFSCNAKQHMPFWLLKDAWLTCNRCFFSVLPTPFWSPIKHLFERLHNQLIDCRLQTCFLHVCFIFAAGLFGIYVMVFQNLICVFNVLKWKGFCIGGWE